MPKIVTDFGTILRNMRMNLGLTMKTVADHIGKSTAYISDVEHGHKGSPRPEVLSKWLEVLQCPERFEELQELAALNRTSIHCPLRSRDPLNPFIVRIIDKYRDNTLSEYERQLLTCIE